MERMQMPVVSRNMILDRVDQADAPVGVIRRRDVFSAHAGFRVAHILIFSSWGDLLLQKLSSRRDRNPGAWGSSVASYLFANESYEQAAYRRLDQELGVTGLALSFVGKTRMDDDGSLKFISVFSAVYDGPFELNRSQIARIEFQSVAAIRQRIVDGSRRFTPTFLHVFRFYLSTVR
jgi:isopentenyldiphosphate isomerase